MPLSSVAVAAAPPYPLPNSDVGVTGISETSGSGGALTDANGNFSISQGLPTGNYSVDVSHQGYIDTNLNTTIVAGQVTDLGLIYLNVSATVTGVVENPSGNGVSGAIVVLMDMNNNSVDSAFTSANGSFTMNTNIATGTYSIVTDVLPGTQYADPLPYTGVNAVAGQTTSGIVIKLLQTGTIAGRVTDAGGNGVSGVDVSASNGTSGSFPIYGGFATTDSQGYYTINSNLATGIYNVSAFAFDIVGVASNYTDVRTVSVTAGSTTTVNFQLLASGSISGTVTWANGNPAAGVDVFASSTGGFFGSATTKADGSYIINSGLPSGNYTVYANGEFSNSKSALVTAPGQTSGVDFKLSTSPAWITGKVSNSTGSLPNANVEGDFNITVTIFGFSFNETTSSFNSTQSDGTYSLQIDVPANDTSEVVSVTASADGYSDSSPQLVTVTVGHTTPNIDFTLQAIPSGTLVGKVVTNSPPPLLTATLNLGASSTAITKGSSVTLTTTIVPVQTGSITLYLSINGSAATSITTGALSSGTFTYTYTPTGTGTYAFYATWPGNSNYNPAQSQNVNVNVTQGAGLLTASLAIQTSATSVNVSSPVTISGSITPSDRAGVVTIYQSVNGSAYASIGTANLASGAYTFTTTPTSPGQYQFYAAWPGDSAYNPVNSTAASVTVTTPAVAQTITLTTSSTSAAVNSTITISGTVSSSTSDVVLYANINGYGNQVVATVAVTNHGYSYSYIANSSGTYAFQAYDPVALIYSTTTTVTVGAGYDYTWVYYIVAIIIIIAIILAAIYAWMRGKKKQTPPPPKKK